MENAVLGFLQGSDSPLVQSACLTLYAVCVNSYLRRLFLIEASIVTGFLETLKATRA